MPSIESICSGILEDGDSRYRATELARWMARPAEGAETKWLSEHQRMLDWSSVLERRAEIIAELLGTR